MDHRPYRRRRESQPAGRSRLAYAPARTCGFSIVELLVVIVVICILAAISFGVYIAIKRSMDVKTARANAGRLAQALAFYESNLNRLPVPRLFDARTAPDDSYENAEVLEQLNGDRTRDPLFVPASDELNAAGSFVDPWGRPFRYLRWKRKPEDLVLKHFQIYSCGPNMKWEMGAGDDLTPAPRD